MSPLRALLGLGTGYLIGSIPFAVLLARASGGFDALREGTRNPGATNVFKHVGRKVGAAVGLLDYFKALVPCLLAQGCLGWGPAEAAAAGVGAVLGHDFSLFLRLRGGKGGASTLGVMTFLDFPSLIGSGILWVLALPLLKGRRFLAGPAALSFFPLLTALHSTPAFEGLFPGWRRGGAPLAAGLGALLVALLWARIAPGLRLPPRVAP